MNREAERKRLVEVVQSAPYGAETLGDYFNKSYIENCIVQHLLDNGIFAPPVKLGQTLYIVAETSKKIVEVTAIGVWMYSDVCAILTDHGSIHKNSIGKTVFTSREDAKKAIEGVGE